MKKKTLVISRQAPYGKSTSREAIDIALAAAIYDQEIAILFMDDGVFQLLKNQHSLYIDQKNTGATLPALSLYGVENIFIHKESLEARAIDTSDLVLEEFQLLDNKAIGQLLNQQDHLLSF